MIIYQNKDVYEAGLERINFIFDEFEHVVVSISGGKDSTVIYQLCLQVARERNRLPLTVFWIDQEAEWQGTVDLCAKIMTLPEVTPMWFQMPMVITNNASSYERYNYCWDEKEKDKWIHPKHPISLKENKYGTIRFHELFEQILKVEYKDQKCCYVAGVRGEETPKRQVSLTNALCYKDKTWGKTLSKRRQHYTLYPIYDWSYHDVWKAIFDNKWEYNEVYSKMFQFGHPINQMRISNLHHETAVQDLMLVQEIEPQTWERIALRIKGANTINQIHKASFACPKELPPMFVSWKDYAMHLFNNIIQLDEHKRLLQRKIDKLSQMYVDDVINNEMWRVIINTILSSDWDLTKIGNWEIKPSIFSYRSAKKNTTKKNNILVSLENKYISDKDKLKIVERFNVK